jgi:hypothetical protein
MHIPFERTITAGYRFGFTKILTVVGIVWFPMLLMAAIIGGLVFMLAPPFMDFFQHLPPQGQQPDPARFAPMFRAFWIAYVVILPCLLIFPAMMRIGVMRKALGLMEGPTFFFFSLGGQVWRLIGAYFLLGIGIWLYCVVSVIVCSILGVALHAAAPAWGALVVVVLGIALACFGIYVAVRTFFFLPAVVVAEDVLGLGRSWELGAGNFWRIIGVVLVIYLPVLFAVGIVNQTIMQATIMPLILQHAGNGEPQTPAQTAAMLREVFAVMGRYLPYFGVVYILQTILLVGIDVGAVATAYKAVTGREGEA